MGPDDVTVPTSVKHVFQTATLGSDGYVYTATGGAYEKNWAEFAKSLTASAQSLQMLSA